MIEQKIEFNVEILSLEEIPLDQQELVKAAYEATENSYANYSNFNVGAAIRLGDGRIVIGANQENAAFPVGLCAERTAIFAAQANYPDQKITHIAVTAKNLNGFLKQPVTPCGSCRQVMLEIEERYKNPMTILLCGTDKIYRIKTVKDLLPLCFVDADMR